MDILTWQTKVNFPNLKISQGTLLHDAPLLTEDQEEKGLKLVVILSGEVTYQTEFSSKVKLSGPCYHLLRSNQKINVQHEYGRKIPIQFISLRLPMDHNVQFLSEIVDPVLPKIKDSHFCNHQVNHKILKISQTILSLKPQNSVNELLVSAKAIELIAECLKHQSNIKATDLNAQVIQQLQEVKYILQHNLSNTPNLRQIARTVGLNSNKLSWCFQQFFGQSVHEYLIELRMQYASDLLTNTHIPISEIAFRCGYTDSHFTKVCKLYLGRSPLQIRRQN